MSLPPLPSTNTGAGFLVGGLIFSTSVIAYTILAIFAPEADARGLFLFAGQFALAIGIGGAVLDVRKKTEHIESQTNGALARNQETLAAAAARKAVEDILTERGLRIASPPTPPPPKGSP